VRAISGTSIIGIQEYWKAMIGGGLSTVSTGGTLTAAAPYSTSGGIYYVGGATTITLDLSNGLTQEILLDRATTTISDAVFGSDPTTPGTPFTVIIKNDGTDGRTVVWGGNFRGVGAVQIDSTPNLLNVFQFMTMRDGKHVRCNTPAFGLI